MSEVTAAEVATVERAIDLLTVDQRVVVTVHDMLRLWRNEIRDILSITEPEVLRLLHRGRSGLRQALETRLGGA